VVVAAVPVAAPVILEVVVLVLVADFGVGACFVVVAVVAAAAAVTASLPLSRFEVLLF
jgi:hypothetical protein